MTRPHHSEAQRSPVVFREPPPTGYLHLAARCLRLIADVDKDRRGLFLFNYFAGHDAEAALAAWEAMAAWYAAETGLDNSTLLQPVDDTPYLFVNHARWDRSLVSFAAAQIVKPSFRTEILGRLHANDMAAMPILYHLVQGDQP
ncbi:MAG: hypothetical protein ACYDEN_07400 [Acidimicrobiales bacterium]